MLTLPCGCVVGCRVLMLPFVAGIGVVVAVGMLIHLLVSLARDAREEKETEDALRNAVEGGRA